MSGIKLYLKYFSIHVRSAMQYKTSFLMTAFGQFLTSFAAFISILILMNRFQSVGGFSVREVLVCYSTILMSFSIAECFFRGFDTFSRMISNGEFERMLTRPRNLVLQIIGSRIEFTRIGRLVQALVVLCVVLPQSNIDWSIAKAVTLVLMILGGVVIFTGLFIVYASICFFSTDGLEFMNIFTDGTKEFGVYPLSIYGKYILKFYTFIIPIATVQYYPLLFVLGRVDSVLYMLCPLASVIFLIPCLILWKIGVRHFRGTGS